MTEIAVCNKLDFGPADIPQNTTPCLREKIHRPGPQASWGVTRTTSVWSLLLFGAFVHGVRGNPFQLNAGNTELDVSFGDVDVARTDEGWFAVWAARATKVFGITGCRVGIGGTIGQERPLYSDEAGAGFPAVGCDRDHCLVAWRQKKELGILFAQLLPKAISLRPANSTSNPQLASRPSVACRSDTNCTVGARWVEGTDYSVKALRYSAGVKVDGELTISGSTIDPLSGVQLRNYGQGQVWIYSIGMENVITARTSHSETSVLGSEFPISSPPSTLSKASMKQLRHWPQLDCLPTGLCAAGWPEGSEELKPRWRLFYANGTMLTGVLSDITATVPDSRSVGVALTDKSMFRAWFRVNGTESQLMYQWADFQGVSVNGPYRLTTVPSDTPFHFAVRRRLNKVFVVWADNGATTKAIMGRVLTFRTAIPKATPVLGPIASIGPIALPPRPSPIMTSLRPSTTVATISSSNVPTLRPPDLPIATTAVPMSLNAGTSILLSASSTSTVPVTVRETSSHSTRPFLTHRQGVSSEARSDSTVAIIAGAISAVVCSIFVGLSGVLGHYLRRKTTESGDPGEFEGQSLKEYEQTSPAAQSTPSEDQQTDIYAEFPLFEEAKKSSNYDVVPDIQHEYEQAHLPLEV